MPAVVSALRPNPCPTPKTIIGSAMPVRYPVSTETRVIQAVPISIAAHPTIAMRSFPTRRVRREVAAALANAAAVAGRNASPASSGVKPLTPWRYCVMKKKKLTSTPLNRKRAT